jgi:hypothetical protein
MKPSSICFPIESVDQKAAILIHDHHHLYQATVVSMLEGILTITVCFQKMWLDVGGI